MFILIKNEVFSFESYWQHSSYTSFNTFLGCTRDQHCPYTLSCIENDCVDPCKSDSTLKLSDCSNCFVRDHKRTCAGNQSNVCIFDGIYCVGRSTYSMTNLISFHQTQWQLSRETVSKRNQFPLRVMGIVTTWMLLCILNMLKVSMIGRDFQKMTFNWRATHGSLFIRDVVARNSCISLITRLITTT